MDDERDVEKYLIRKVRALGGMTEKHVSPGRAGVLDRICIFPGGRVWFVEVKRETGRLSKQQRAEIRRLEKFGASWAVVYGKTGVDLWLKAQLPGNYYGGIDTYAH